MTRSEKRINPNVMEKCGINCRIYLRPFPALLYSSASSITYTITLIINPTNKKGQIRNEKVYVYAHAIIYMQDKSRHSI